MNSNLSDITICPPQTGLYCTDRALQLTGLRSSHLHTLGYFDCILQGEFCFRQQLLLCRLTPEPTHKSVPKGFDQVRPKLTMSFRSSEMYSATLSPLAC